MCPWTRVNSSLTNRSHGNTGAKYRWDVRPGSVAGASHRPGGGAAAPAIVGVVPAACASGDLPAVRLGRASGVGLAAINRPTRPVAAALADLARLDIHAGTCRGNCEGGAPMTPKSGDLPPRVLFNGAFVVAIQLSVPAPPREPRWRKWLWAIATVVAITSGVVTVLNRVRPFSESLPSMAPRPAQKRPMRADFGVVDQDPLIWQPQPTCARRSPLEGVLSAARPRSQRSRRRSGGTVRAPAAPRRDRTWVESRPCGPVA